MITFRKLSNLHPLGEKHNRTFSHSVVDEITYTTNGAIQDNEYNSPLRKVIHLSPSGGSVEGGN
ncbi:MAG: hypothetical protein IPP77_09180 [Bacteroidetes bacterium]|nr:hypothetical protein [Bacteroidota bacterium]